MKKVMNQMMKVAAVVMAAMVATSPLPAHAMTAEAAMVQTERAAAEQIYATYAAANVQDIPAMMRSLQAYYPEGTSWTNATTYWNYDVWNCYAGGCAAFAMLASDTAYGTKAPVVQLTGVTAADIQPGDVVRVNNTHSVFVTAVTADTITVCEGNYNKSVHWGRVITKASLAGKTTYIMRRV